MSGIVPPSRHHSNRFSTRRERRTAVSHPSTRNSSPQALFNLIVRRKLSLFENQLSRILREVRRVAVECEQPADFAAQVGADGLAARPIELGHAFDHFS